MIIYRVIILPMSVYVSIYSTTVYKLVWTLEVNEINVSLQSSQCIVCMIMV